MAKSTTKSELANGQPEFRDGCPEHPETKICPASCPKVTGVKPE